MDIVSSSQSGVEIQVGLVDSIIGLLLHNIILHYLTEMGLIGTVPLVALFVYIVYWSAKNRENIMARAMLYAMAALFINNMVDYQFIVKQYYQLFWVLCGGTIADVYLKKEKFICG